MSNNMFLSITLGSQDYGINITKVREIVTYKNVTAIPDSPAWLKGVLDIRGEDMPVIDLRIRFHFNPTPTYNERTVIVSVKNSEDKLIGFVVDEVKDIETIEMDNIVPPSKNDYIDAKFLKGYIRREDAMMIVLDMDRLVDKEIAFKE
jgi:purine-binding chemotaxis protein CheW